MSSVVVSLLHENCPYKETQGVDFEFKQLGEDRVKEDRLLCDLLLQHVEYLLSSCCSYKGLTLFSECVEGQGNLGETCNEGVIKIAESMKRANILNTFWGRPVTDS